jgi:hypothetical protein
MPLTCLRRILGRNTPKHTKPRSALAQSAETRTLQGTRRTERRSVKAYVALGLEGVLVLRSRVESMARYMVALDTETHRISLGILAPEIVCASAAWLEPGPRVQGTLLNKEQAQEVFLRALEDSNTVIVGANISYDLLVIAVKFARRGIDIMPHLFAAFEQSRIYDIQVAEALNAIAYGQLGKDPRTGGGLKDPTTGKPGRYSLAICVDITLGRQDAKANSEWRLRYGELDGLPMDQWPPAARDYPIDDCRNTGEVALAQTGHIAKMSAQHDWANYKTDDGRVFTACKDCGTSRFSQNCMKREMHKNLHEVANQTYSAFCLHLGAAWGFHVDQSKVDVIERYALWRREKLIGPFIEAGIIRADGTENRSVLKRLIALAYGASEPCPHCNGTGKVPHPEQPTLQCPDCRGRCVPWKAGGKIKAPEVASCARCSNTGRVLHHNVKMTGCSDADEITCDGTGLMLTPDVPRAKKDGIQFGRDALVESGDEHLLMPYGYYLEDAKVLKDYVPYLREARAPIAGHLAECPFAKDPDDETCTCPGPYYDIPLTLKPNAVLATGRVSYSRYVQLFPRAPGYIVKEPGSSWDGAYIPSLRECIVARGPRTEVVEVPEGYCLQPGEEFVFA